MGIGIGRIREAVSEAGGAEPVFENDTFFKVMFWRQASKASDKKR